MKNIQLESWRRSLAIRAFLFSTVATGIFLCLIPFRPRDLNRLDFMLLVILIFLGLGFILARKVQAFSFLQMAKAVFSTFFTTIFVIVGLIYTIWPKQRLLALSFDDTRNIFDLSLLVASASFFSWSWLACLLAYVVIAYRLPRAG